MGAAETGDRIVSHMERFVCFLVPTLALALAASLASAQREHTVRSGDSLARIAKRHNVSLTSLAGANGLAPDAGLRPGQVLRVPERGTHYVAPGETLGAIARNHECSVEDLRRLNRLREGRPLQIGQRLILPGFEASRERARAADRWGRPRQPGVVTIYRSSLDRRFRIRLVDNRGRVRSAAVRRLQELMRQRDGSGRLGPRGPAPPRRLVAMLARISDHFGGRTITLVSGYRETGGYTRATSRHVEGHALDIRVRGVPATELRDYVRSTFERVGVGYYPRSTFVHIDVRDRNRYWVDWSRPGQRPQYQRRGDAAPEDATAEEVARTGMGNGRADEEGEGAAAGEEDDPSRDPDRAALSEDADEADREE